MRRMGLDLERMPRARAIAWSAAAAAALLAFVSLLFRRYRLEPDPIVVIVSLTLLVFGVHPIILLRYRNLSTHAARRLAFLVQSTPLLVALAYYWSNYRPEGGGLLLAVTFAWLLFAAGELTGWRLLGGYLPIWGGVIALWILAMGVSGAFRGSFFHLPAYGRDAGVSQSNVLMAGLLFLFWFPGFRLYSLPTSPTGLIPLLTFYFLLVLSLTTRGAIFPALLMGAYLPLSGYLFPAHRRMREYWKPAPLPKIRGARRGVTLIELLIMVAVLAILSGGVVNLTATTSRAFERQRDWREAIELAEDQIALLQGMERLPSLGVHPVHDELAARSPLAAGAEVVIGDGPAPGLALVRVTVRLRGEGRDRDVTLAAIVSEGSKSGP